MKKFPLPEREQAQQNELENLNRPWTPAEKEEGLRFRKHEMGIINLDPMTPEETSLLKEFTAVADKVKHALYNGHRRDNRSTDEFFHAVTAAGFGRRYEHRPEYGDSHYNPVEYIVPPKNAAEPGEGWIFRSEVNLIVGASGSGKTTAMLDLLEALRHGKSVFGHPEPAEPLEYRIIMHDRSKRSFERTARRMKLKPEARERVYRLSRAQQKSDACEVINCYLERLLESGEKGPPDVLLVEGLDFWIPKSSKGINDGASVEDFVADLQELAESWDIALVGSVGCPKQKEKDRYVLTREQAMGSANWGRKVDTILHIQQSDPKDPNSDRVLQALLRDGPAERFTLAWRNGVLVATEGTPDPEPLEGVAETRATLDRLKSSERFNLMIEAIRKMPPGTVIDTRSSFPWIKRQGTVIEYLRELAKPGSPVAVAKVQQGRHYRWVVGESVVVNECSREMTTTKFDDYKTE